MGGLKGVGVESPVSVSLPAPGGLLTVFYVSWLLEASPQSLPSVRTVVTLCACFVSPLPVYADTSCIASGPTLMTSLLTFAMTLFPNKSHIELLVVRIST